MKFKPVAVAMIALMPMLTVDFADAAFGRSSSSGVSRSYSRPSTPTVNKSIYSAPKASQTYSQPRSTYSAPKQTYQAQPQQYRQQQYNSNSGYNNNYNNSGYKPRSTMGDIGVGVASVAGGMLAAQAITSLISSPGHAGLYTHPQYPGQYFNSQGVPQQAPQQQSAPVQQPVQSAPQQGYVEQPQYAPQVQQPYQVQPQQPAYVQPKEKGFFGYLWSGLFSILHLIFFGAVVAGLGYLGFRTFRKGKQVIDDQKAFGSMDKHQKDLSNNAQSLFCDIQEKSNNMAFLKANTKYLPIADMMDEPSSVVQFEQGAVDVAVESGKVRGSVLYRAKLKKADGSTESIREYWNFENENGVWKLIGIDQA